MHTEHTPGPWILRTQNFDPPNDWSLHIDAGSTEIASIDVQGTKRRMGEYLADGRLIASAPAMHQALEAIIAWVDGEWGHPALISYGLLEPDLKEGVKRIAKSTLGHVHNDDSAYPPAAGTS